MSTLFFKKICISSKDYLLFFQKLLFFSEGRTYRSESGESFLSKAGWQETKLYGDGNR